MGLPYGINNSVGKISLENSCRILAKAFDLGISTLDSAEAYGEAHHVIGEFHKANPKYKFDIITKIPNAIADIDIEKRIEKYCRDLQVDHLEVLLFHSFDSYANNPKLLPVLDKIKSRGLINNIGVSVYTNNQIERLLHDELISVVQMPFNLLDNESIRGSLMQQLKDQGKKIHTRSAFLQGLFFTESTENNPVADNLSEELALIRNIAKEENMTISALALSYCLRQKHIDQVLIGVDSVEQLTENIEASNHRIRPEIMDRIKAIRVKNVDLLNPSLWK